MADPQIQGLPEGATVGQPVPANTSIQGLPAGATVGQPVQQDTPASSSSGQSSSDEDSGGLFGFKSAAGDIAAGVGKGIMEGVHGVGTLIGKGVDAMSAVAPERALESLGLISKGTTEKVAGKVKEALVPEAGMKAEESMTHPEGTAQWIGYGGENLAEFLLGDEALKGLSMAEKFEQIAKATKIFEKSPRLMKAIQMGVDVHKAAGELGPEEAAAIKKSPILARLVGAGMDALRQGTVQAAQTTAKTGDVKKGVEEGATMTATSGVLGGAFGVLGRAGEKAGEAGKAVQEASERGVAAETKKQVGDVVSGQVRDAEQTMHTDFEKGITDLKGKLGDVKVPYKGSPLQQAAADAMEGRADVPSQKTTALGKEFKDLAGGSEQTKKLLFGLTDPSKEGDLTIDELIQRRQQLGEKIGNLTKGATSSADRADVQVYQKLRDGIDQTIDAMAKSSDSPEASQDYAALRNAYKQKVGLFKEPIVLSLMEEGTDKGTALDNAGKELLAGKKSLDKVNTLEKVIGPDALKQFGQHIASSVMRDATSEGGQINPVKFVKEWKKIDALPPEVKTKLFDMTGAGDGLDKLSKDLKSAANYQRLVRAGVLTTAGGGLTHGWGAALGLLSEAAPTKVGDLLDIVANRPGMWKAFEKAGQTAQKVATSPTARRAATAVKYGTGSALSNVLQGASEPLSSPIEQDESGTYTNQ
jgi:hypothetical protein